MKDQDAGKYWDIGVTGAVVHDRKVLYVRRNYEPHKGTWTLPGGYVNHDETLDAAVQRELLEETGLEISVKGIVGVRTRYDEKGGAVLIIFRAEAPTGEPHADEYEISAAEFFDAGQIAALESVFPLSRAFGLRMLSSESIGLTEIDVPLSSTAQWRAYSI